MKHLLVFIILIIFLTSCSKVDNGEVELSDFDIEEVWQPTNESQVVEREPLLTAMPDDFEIILRYGVGAGNTLNTKDQYIEKDLVGSGKAKVDYMLPDDIKKQLYQRLFDIEIQQYPEYFESPYYKGDLHKGGHEPFELYKLEIFSDNKEYYIRWEDRYDNTEGTIDIMGDNLRNIYKWLIDIIEDSEEYKSLPKNDGWYE